MRYRLGLDLGANSLGWCIVELDDHGQPFRLVRMGVRIFRDGRNPKDKQSLAVARRLARGMRRRRDRWVRRQQRFMAALIKHGLMPADEAERKALVALDPYELRAQALDAPLAASHVARALVHLGKRRGFQSNRKADKSADNESGKIKTAIKALERSANGLQVATLAGNPFVAGCTAKVQKPLEGGTRLEAGFIGLFRSSSARIDCRSALDHFFGSDAVGVTNPKIWRVSFRHENPYEKFKCQTWYGLGW